MDGVSYLNNSTSTEYKIDMSVGTLCWCFWMRQLSWVNGDNVPAWDTSLAGNDVNFFLNFPTVGEMDCNVTGGGGTTPILTGSDTGWIWCGVIVSNLSFPNAQARVMTRRENSSTYTDVTLSGSIGAPASAVTWLGGNGNPGRAMYMSKVFMYNSVTAAQLQAQSAQDTPVDPTTSNLVAWFSCANGSTVGHDQSGNGNNGTVTGAIVTDAAEPIIALPGGGPVVLAPYTPFVPMGFNF